MNTRRGKEFFFKDNEDDRFIKTLYAVKAKDQKHQNLTRVMNLSCIPACVRFDFVLRSTFVVTCTIGI